MTSVPMPTWTSEGVLPPRTSTILGSSERSPYVVQLTDLVVRFGTTPQRRAILDGLLRFRSALHVAGLDRGFQWLDGSFAENIELIESRPPNDIDVVTFYRLPEGATQQSFAPRLGDLFDHDEVKRRYRVDAYWVDLATEPTRLVERSAYWYSMWAHRRTDAWKGFLQVDLARVEDVVARLALEHTPPGAAP